jgi:hypothetical protein
MLRYLYTLDCRRIFRQDDPLFIDVERDLDVLAIADKFGLQPLKQYMSDSLYCSMRLTRDLLAIRVVGP